MSIKEELDSFFESEGVEYYAVLDYGVLREINGNIMKRESFTPRSVVIFLIPYYTAEGKNISRYAVSKDYHIIIREITDRLNERLRELFPSSSAKGYGDHSPIDERHAALIGGLGIVGDNGLLINEKYGSYVFVADSVTDIPAEQLGATAPAEIKECIHCGECRRACPTGILRAEGDSCLSYITQKKGELQEWEAELMRRYNTAWGCDMCQTCCPYNKKAKQTPIEFFYEDNIDSLTEDTLKMMTDDEFKSRAFAWRGRGTVERNIRILAENEK